jgi:hypothetical protein
MKLKSLLKSCLILLPGVLLSTRNEGWMTALSWVTVFVVLVSFGLWMVAKASPVARQAGRGKLADDY